MSLNNKQGFISNLTRKDSGNGSGYKRRFLALLLSIVVLFEFAPFSLNTPSTAETSSASVGSNIVLSGAYIDYDETLTYMGGSTYLLRYTAQSDVKSTFNPYVRTYSKDGYFTATANGYYLFELWGTTGGDGTYIATGGGTGGSAGYVYGYTWLDAGQTIVFSIGTNGELTYYSSEPGANEGGASGAASALSWVGTGGGYSSVYLVDSSAFSTSWFDEEGHLDKSAMGNIALTDVIMIAGGGGGGGTAISPVLYAVAQVDFEPVGHANGGGAGTIFNERKGHLSADDNNGVAGTYFAGYDGQSSSIGISYGGKGGTSLPGAPVSSSGNLSNSSQSGNDWTGSHNPDLAPGAGGSGAYRGGGGGAGFTGGSGGNMKNFLNAEEVGGGGGGSSFIADSVTWQGLPSAISAYLEGEGGNKFKSTGGGLEISYLGESDTSPEIAALMNVSLTGSISKYFEVIDVNTNGNGTATVTKSSSNADYTSTVTVTGINMMPNSHGTVDETNYLNVEVWVKPKDGFLGGNYVQLIQTNFTYMPQGYAAVTFNQNNDVKTRYCNVPYAFKLKTYSKSTTVNSVISFAYNSLYDQSTYVNYLGKSRTTLDDYWQSYYLNNVTKVSHAKEPSDTNVISLSGTDYYRTSNVAGSARVRLYFEVTPQYAATNTTVTSLVGPICGVETLNFYSPVTVLGVDSASLGEYTVTGRKSLDYLSDYFNLHTNIEQKSYVVNVPTDTDSFETVGNGSYTIEHEGWYFVQLWGADGTGVKTFKFEFSALTTRTCSGNVGGTGGYVAGYMYLYAGDTLYYTVGAEGTAHYKTYHSVPTYQNLLNQTKNSITDGSTTVTLNCRTGSSGPGSSRTYAYYDSVTGGGFSSLRTTSSYIAIAGGGGSAGGNVIVGARNNTKETYKPAGGGTVPAGQSVDNSTFVSSGTINTAEYSGKGHEAYFNQEAFEALTANNVDSLADSTGFGEAGEAGKNYRDNTLTQTTQDGHTLSAYGQTIASNLSSEDHSGGDGKFAITYLDGPELEAARNGLSSLNVSDYVSRYFDVADVTFSAGVTLTNATVANNADGSVTKSYTDPNGLPVSFTYRLTPAADHTTRVDITDVTNAIRAANPSAGQTVYYATTNYTLKIVPKEGFLGGYDVPLLLYDRIYPSGTDVNGTPEQGVAIFTQDESWKLFLTGQNNIDYANVPINYTFSEGDLVTQDLDVIYNSQHSTGELIVSEKSESDFLAPYEPWQYEFVHFERSSDSDDVKDVTVLNTVTYDFTQKLVPNDRIVVKASVVQTVEPVENVQKGTFNVQYTVTADFTHLTWNGPETVPQGQGVNGYIVVEPGYLLPDSVSVTRNGSALGSSYYSYNSNTGEFTIDPANMTGNIVITAVAGVPTYNVHYSYETSPGVVATWDDPNDYLPGDPITDYTSVLDAEHEAVYGYNYYWRWSSLDGSPLTEMPASDVYVIGSYYGKVYNLTINYYYENSSDPIATAYTDQLIYQSTYSVVSPNVSGYLADQTTVSGTITEDTVINVYYSPTAGLLTIIYIKNDTSEEISRFSSTDYATGQSYSITSPSVTGYTPDHEVISGTMSASGDTYYVYYSPNNYTVTFDPNGGLLASSELSKTVQFNNIYGFDPSLPAGSQYSDLPTPLLNGFTFDGWYLGDVLVKADSVVSTASDHTLVAHWRKNTYNITIYYNYSTGAQAADTYSNSYEYDASYSITSPSIPGWTPDQAVVSGQMGAGNKIVYVVYNIDSHSITIHYIDPEGNPMSVWSSSAADYSTSQDYQTTYTKASPVVTGFVLDDERNGGDMSVVTGTVGTEDIVINVYYAYIMYDLTITYTGVVSPDENPAQVNASIHVGETLDYLSPLVVGYTPDIATVSATLDSTSPAALTYTVTYSKNQHTLTIEYVFDEDVAEEDKEGVTLPPTYSQDYYYRDQFSVDSPDVEGFTAVPRRVTGQMGDDNMSYTVVYSLHVSIEVLVTWSELKFDYVYIGHNWDPLTHTYEYFDYSFGPHADGSNLITVENTDESGMDVNITLTYSPLTDYTFFSSKFTYVNDETAEQAAETKLLEIGEQQAYYLWLTGEFPDLKDSGTYTVGSCTVTVTGG